MAESTILPNVAYTPCAPLAALGLYLQQIAFFQPIRDHVRIAQKQVVHAPHDKLVDAFITILAGAHGLVEVNTRVRSDHALQAAFGRDGCADQSTIQATLNACTETNVTQLTAAVTAMYRQHSHGFVHPYDQRLQLLDVDLSGIPCGPKAALATKGYFANARNRRGRQLGRVVASHYGEVVVDQVFAGTTGLTTALRPLVTAAAQVLDLDTDRRRQTILRIDSGGGSLAELNWALTEGYHIHAKDYSRQRARKLGQSVTAWVDDPAIPGRQVGWVTTPAPEYNRLVRRVAVRWQQPDGQWEYAVVISTLTADDVITLMGQPPAAVQNHAAVVLAYTRFYDQRGGGVESTFKDDKQGLGLTKRNKKRLAAHQMVVLLGTLAHNVIMWARRWLAPGAPAVRRYGVKRIVRDLFHLSGFLVYADQGHVIEVVLNQHAPLAHGLSHSLQLLLRPAHIAVNWGQT